MEAARKKVKFPNEPENPNERHSQPRIRPEPKAQMRLLTKPPGNLAGVNHKS